MSERATRFTIRELEARVAPCGGCLPALSGLTGATADVNASVGPNGAAADIGANAAGNKLSASLSAPLKLNTGCP